MSISNRPSLNLFCAMFPGDAVRSVPAAAATTALVSFQKHFSALDEVDTLLREGHAESAAGDPNDILKALKTSAPDLIDRFIEQAVMAYFSDPAVSRALTSKPTPLFPHATVMPEIDYDLLEPVITNCRGHAHDQ